MVFLQVFSIVVFGCIASQGWHRGYCFDDKNVSHGVCGYGTAVGVLAFLLLLIFLGLDALFDTISNVQLRKYIVVADILCFGKFLCFYFYQRGYVLPWLVGLSVSSITQKNNG